MTDRVSKERTKAILEDYKPNEQDAILNALGATREYVQDGVRTNNPSYRPEGMHYEGVSEVDLKEFDEALSTLRAGYRKSSVNEEAMYDQIAGGEIEIFAPWNVGDSDQPLQEILKTASALQRYAETIEDETKLDAQVTVYSLEGYANLNNNSFAKIKSSVESVVGPMDNLEFMDWSAFTNKVLLGNWAKEKKEREKEFRTLPEDEKEELRNNSQEGDSMVYNGMRKAESTLMNGQIRLSPGKPDDDNRKIVPRPDNPKDGEAVIYGPFVGSWKEIYVEEEKKVPELLANMRS